MDRDTPDTQTRHRQHQASFIVHVHDKGQPLDPVFGTPPLTETATITVSAAPSSDGQHMVVSFSVSFRDGIPESLKALIRRAFYAQTFDSARFDADDEDILHYLKNLCEKRLVRFDIRGEVQSLREE